MLVPPTVVVVEDQSVFRRWLVRALAEPPIAFDVVGQADNGHDGLALIEREQPTIALLDLRLPDIDGLELARRLRDGNGAATHTVLLSAHADPNLIHQAVAAGARGYLSKAAPRTELEENLRRVAAGGVAFPEPPPD